MFGALLAQLNGYKCVLCYFVLHTVVYINRAKPLILKVIQLNQRLSVLRLGAQSGQRYNQWNHRVKGG